MRSRTFTPAAVPLYPHSDHGADSKAVSTKQAASLEQRKGMHPNGQFEMHPCRAASSDRILVSARMMLERKVLNRFEQPPSHATKVRNVSKVGSQTSAFRKIPTYSLTPTQSPHVREALALTRFGVNNFQRTTLRLSPCRRTAERPSVSQTRASRTEPLHTRRGHFRYLTGSESRGSHNESFPKLAGCAAATDCDAMEL